MMENKERISLYLDADIDPEADAEHFNMEMKSLIPIKVS